MWCVSLAPYQASVSIRVQLISASVGYTMEADSMVFLYQLGNKDYYQGKHLSIVCMLYSTHIYLVQSRIQGIHPRDKHPLSLEL